MQAAFPYPEALVLYLSTCGLDRCTSQPGALVLNFELLTKPILYTINMMK